VRAWEVLAATGTPLSEWQRRKGEAFPGAALGIVLSPPRPELVARITHRIDAMVAAGVLDEVAAFLDLGLPPDAPARGAVGLEEFAAYLAGTTPLEVAKARAAAATRQLAKRQTTWCRNQMSSWEVFQQETERFVNTFFPKILQLLLTRDD
jgi:tRNA dimethylallyltransferase